MDKQTTFESVTCGRCGGSGHYSFNLIDGSRCYGCGGAGVKYTKRGRMARDLYTNLCSVPAGEVEPGMQIWDSGKWHTVQAVEPSTIRVLWNGTRRPPGLDIVCTGVVLGATNPDSVIRVRQTPEQAAAKTAQALAYQESLTKSGTPRKGKRGQ